MGFYQGLNAAPQSLPLVASGDYKSVDPENWDIELPEHCDTVTVNLNVTAASGGGGVTITIQGYDEGSGTWFTLLASALKTGTGFTRLIVGPNIAASANVSAQTTVTKKVRVNSVGSGVRTTLNYSVGIDMT